jgi:hypothetical protein
MPEGPHGRVRLLRRAKYLQVPLDVTLILLLRTAPGIVGCPHPPRVGAPKSERCNALGVGGREQDGESGPLRKRGEGRAVGAGRIHDRP